ncbi:MAG: hypothetical protein ABI651_09785, partial [Verrucomicrobiota bacterium]
IKFTLTNTTANPLKVPANLSLKSGNVSGKVVDPKGNVRAFLSIIKCMDGGARRDLKSQESVTEWMTLLRGPDGALFPEPGVYRVIVKISWKDCTQDRQAEFVEELKQAGVADESKAKQIASKCFCASNELRVHSVQGETRLRVRKPLNDDENHQKIAEQILNTPDTLLCLAIGGDHMVEGVEVIKSAVNNPAYAMLKPHWAIVEAKRWAQRHFGRAADIVTACKSIDEDTVLSVPECKRMLELMRDAKDKADHDEVRRVSDILNEKVRKMETKEESDKFTHSVDAFWNSFKKP